MNTAPGVSVVCGWRHHCADQRFTGYVLHDARDGGWFRCGECGKSTRQMASGQDGFEEMERQEGRA